MAADSHLFSNTVNKILQRVALQEGREGGTAAHSTIHHGPLTQMELSDLSLLCTRATHETGPSFESVEKEEIAALIEYLEKHVNLACGVHIIEDVCAFLQNQGSLKDFFKHDSAMTSLRMGLEAAGIITFITSTKGIDRRATNQDAMEACMTLMRGHLFKSIIPALCNKGHLVGGVQQQNTLDIKASPTKKRRTSVEPNAVSADSGSSLVDAKHLKTVYKRISDTLTLQLTLMERLATLVNEVTLDGQQILLLTNSAFAVLEIDSASREAVQLQLVSNDLVTTVFRKYPMHRETILEDLFPLLMRLPATKKQLRTYTIESSFVNYQAQCLRNILPTPGKQIQMFTFVLVSLIQSCVTRPTFDPVENGPYQLLSGLRPCRTVCEFWVAQLLQRCTRSGGDLRNVLVHLVEDLLCMFTTVPGAELLLQTFQTRLTYDLNQASPSFKTKTSAKQGNYEQTYLNTCFEIVGTVCAVQARLLATQRGAKAQGATTSSSLDGQDDDEICVQCYCGQTDDSRSLVACDHCKTFYHVNCVGFSPDAEEWFCDACHLGHLVERERVKYHGEQTCIDEVYALYHTHYSNLSNLDNGLQDATRMHLCRWVDHLEKQAEGTEKVKPRHILTGLLQLWERPAPAGKPSTNESMNRLIHALLAKTSSLCLSFKSNVAFVLKLMGDESSQVLRKLSLKALEKIIEADPQLMLLPIVTKAVSKRLVDDSISVREAVVSLVGTYVAQSPAVANSFHASLLPCLSDSGVSVRKRAVRIFQDVLTSNPRYTGRSVVCRLMLERALDPKEEDTVRDIIYELFGKLWLEDGEAIFPVIGTAMPLPIPHEEVDTLCTGPVSPNAASIAGRAGFVTPTPTISALSKKNSLPQKRADIAAEQMMEVVRAGGTNEHLEALLHKLLDAKKDGNEGQKKSLRRKGQARGGKQIENLVNSLFELLLAIEEQRTARGPCIGKDIAATLQVIVTFAEISPNMVLTHVDTLLPYLKVDNGVAQDESAAIVGAACDVLYQLASTLGKGAASLLSSKAVGHDLRQVTYCLSADASESAIRAWSTIIQNQEGCHESAFAKELFKVAHAFYSYLYKSNNISDFSTVDMKVRGNVHRALTILGFVCQHRTEHLDAEEWQVETLVTPDEFSWANVTIACYRMFAQYLSKLDAPTKGVALRAFGCMFVAQPRLMLQLEAVGIIAAVMSDESPLELQLESLQCWRKILVVEEKRVDGGKARAKTDAGHSLTERISGDQDGDSSILGGVLNAHAERLFDLTQSKDRKIRYASLELIDVLLRQGLVNPNDAVPYLFSLQGDIEQHQNRCVALRLLMTEGEKRPDMIRQRICAGVKKAYEFQRTMYPHKTSVSALVEEKRGRSVVHACIFDCVFKECIRSSRKQRLGLYDNLLSQFEADNSSSRSFGTPKGARKKEIRSLDLDLLGFSAQILAHLPYNSAEEPLYIIYKISSVITLHGGQILDKLASILRPIGLASSDDLDEVNTSEDVLEKIANAKSPSRTQEGKLLNSKVADKEQFADLCRDGFALTILLRLKDFLRGMYNLSETRCLQYDPNAKDRIAEKGISKADARKLFDPNVPPDARKENDKVINDTTIRQYAEFRVLMRKEMAGNLEASMGEDCDEVSVPDIEHESENGSPQKSRAEEIQ